EALRLISQDLYRKSIRTGFRHTSLYPPLPGLLQDLPHAVDKVLRKVQIQENEICQMGMPLIKSGFFHIHKRKPPFLFFFFHALAAGKVNGVVCIKRNISAGNQNAVLISSVEESLPSGCSPAGEDLAVDQTGLRPFQKDL